jgi:hypothetical protein
VTRVTYQGQRIRPISPDEFDEHDDPGDSSGNQQRFPVSFETMKGSSSANAFMSMMFMLNHLFSL